MPTSSYSSHSAHLHNARFLMLTRWICTLGRPATRQHYKLARRHSRPRRSSLHYGQTQPSLAWRSSRSPCCACTSKQYTNRVHIYPKTKGAFFPLSPISHLLTNTPPFSKRSPPLGHIWSWPFTVLRADFHAIKDQNGVDAYMFIRFLRMMVRIFAPIWIISWAILLPVNGVESGSNKTGLDRFTFGNIGTEKQGRYWAHLACAWVFTSEYLALL